MHYSRQHDGQHANVPARQVGKYTPLGEQAEESAEHIRCAAQGSHIVRL